MNKNKDSKQHTDDASMDALQFFLRRGVGGSIMACRMHTEAAN